MKNICFQKIIKDQHYLRTINESALSAAEIKELRASDLKFYNVPKNNRDLVRDINKHIEVFEWMGKPHRRVTHYFIAAIGDELVCVNTMSIPNTFSHLLGPENSKFEKLISRGASSSLAPKNTASKMLKFSIDWMVKNTEFRYFTAYSDPEAGELGTVYQAANFIYLGQTHGARKLFRDPKNPQWGWFCSRNFRKLNSYKRYAKELGIEWNKNWVKGRILSWGHVPFNIEKELRQAAKDHEARCDSRVPLKKHKYVFIKGKDKRETRRLIEAFYEHNPKMIPKKKGIRPGLPYPKVRGE